MARPSHNKIRNRDEIFTIRVILEYRFAFFVVFLLGCPTDHVDVTDLVGHCSVEGRNGEVDVEMNNIPADRLCLPN
jgi:hypothetical protein